jgi:hypothetical protein
MHGLENVLDLTGFKILFALEPNIMLGYIVVNLDVRAAKDSRWLIGSNAECFHYAIFDLVVVDLVLDVSISGDPKLCIICKLPEVRYVKNVACCLQSLQIQHVLVL